ncbi:MAG: hypothetical protein L6V88_07435 [Anaerotruncus sp.]|nr:MAG: hypothetical protein L6V88_07435 [Anaerotruncus sp.]
MPIITGGECGEKLNIFAFEAPNGDYVIVAEKRGRRNRYRNKLRQKKRRNIHHHAKAEFFYREKEAAFCGKLHLKAKSLTTARLYNGE